jgi:hypothetical protein
MIPNHNERQLMQQLRGRGWVKGSELPPSVLIARLLQRGWIEGRGTGRELEYRITEEGMAAKSAPIPDYGRSRRGNGDRRVI